jgi:hypothetical protein
MSIFFTGGCLVATLKYHVTTPGIHNQKNYPTKKGFFIKIVCTNELEVLLGPKVASLSVRGKNNKIMNPAPVAMMHLLWEHPRPWVLPRVKPYKIFFCTPPPLFSSDTPSGVTRGEMKEINK